MGDRHIPIIDEDKLDEIITALQALSAPSGTDVAISPTGMHIVTEDDVQGAISELDSAVDSVNASLTNNVNLKKWTLKTNSSMVVNDQLDISDAGKNILIGTNLSTPTSIGRGRIVIPNIDGASYYVSSSNGTAIHFRVEISNNKLTLLAITTGYKIEAVYI